MIYVVVLCGVVFILVLLVIINVLFTCNIYGAALYISILTVAILAQVCACDPRTAVCIIQTRIYIFINSAFTLYPNTRSTLTW